MQEVYDEAVEQQKADAATAKKPPTEPKAPGEGIDHEPVTQSRQGSPITIKAQRRFQPEREEGRAVVQRRRRRRLRREGDEGGVAGHVRSREIPASATQGGRVDYFIEALGDNDVGLASKGSEKDTLKIAMLGPNGQPLAPAIRKGKKPPEKPAADESPSLVLRAEHRQRRRLDDGERRDLRGDKVNPAGFAMAKLLHFAPEVGYYLSPDLLLSVQLRLQIISRRDRVPLDADTGCGPDNVCSAGHVRVRRLRARELLLRRGRPAHLRRGQSRARDDPPPRDVRIAADRAARTDDQTCIDTVAVGPRLRRRSAPGIMYNVSPAFALTLGTNAVLGFTKFTFNVDLNAGVAFEY